MTTPSPSQAYEQLREIIVKKVPEIMRKKNRDCDCEECRLEEPRPITLEDVLRAAQKADIESLSINSDGTLWEGDQYSGLPSQWILGKPLSDQSSELINFLLSLLSQKTV